MRVRRFQSSKSVKVRTNIRTFKIKTNAKKCNSDGGGTRLAETTDGNFLTRARE